MSESLAQSGKWDVYMAQYENGSGSTTVNMDLINSAPKAELPFVLITGVTIENCRDDGFPNAEEFKNLYEISDAVGERLQELTKIELAGTFTYRCERLDYLYVSDTSLIREELITLYQTKFAAYKYYVNIKTDAHWEAYLQFLYPNEVTQEYMANEKVLMQLQQAGDDLTKSRKVDHWLYFATEESKKMFLKYVKKKGFRVEGEDKIGGSELPFQLHISRNDPVSPNEISSLTLDLRRRAEEFKGDYDGWETIVIKE
ncbi:MAG: DUF695 domain-containing protein [Reichenbachiella sp.]|uniref:DUF695 domain-containing protein n=1 Tax=Reichenbachiella sp. TaxID=2184521 RepID=UPI0032661419